MGKSDAERIADLEADVRDAKRAIELLVNALDETNKTFAMLIAGRKSG